MKLKIKVMKAILTHNTQIGSNMDPFVVIKIGTDQQRTITLQEAGDMPEWNKQFVFQINKSSTTLHLIVYDQDNVIDDIVGQLVLDIRRLISNPFTAKKWYSLKYDVKKPAGKIMLEFECGQLGNMQTYNPQVVKQITKPHIHHIGEQSSLRQNSMYQPIKFNPQSVSLTSLYSLEIPTNKVCYSFRNHDASNVANSNIYLNNTTRSNVSINLPSNVEIRPLNAPGIRTINKSQQMTKYLPYGEIVTPMHKNHQKPLTVFQSKPVLTVNSYQSFPRKQFIANNRPFIQQRQSISPINNVYFNKI